VKRHITIRLTQAQANAASNACDLIRDQLEADGRRREAAVYQRTSDVLDVFLREFRARNGAKP
jgi:hypothetical protein